MEKPEYLPLPDVRRLCEALDLASPARLELDICRGALPVGAVLTPEVMQDHETRAAAAACETPEDAERALWAKRSRVVLLQPDGAAGVLREGAAQFYGADYPVFIDSNGTTERYRLELAKFKHPGPIYAADLVVFAFQWLDYKARARGRPEPVRAELPPAPDAGRYLVGVAVDPWEELGLADSIRRRSAAQNDTRRVLELAAEALSARGAPQEGSAPPPDPRRSLGRLALQDAALDRIVRELGHDPENLPQHVEPGRPGLRAEAWELARQQPGVFTKETFRKAWQRLRSQPRAEEGKHRGT